jgi:menaquinone-dependent protoporphyrinogen oxidase
VIRPEHLSRTGRLLFRLFGCRYGDYRDRTSIGTWAHDIARKLPVDLGR